MRAASASAGVTLNSVLITASANEKQSAFLAHVTVMIPAMPERLPASRKGQAETHGRVDFHEVVEAHYLLTESVRHDQSA